MASGTGSGISTNAMTSGRATVTAPRPRTDGRSGRARAVLYSNLSPEDQQSTAAQYEDRPNNWDFSDWRPGTVFDSSKRIKKENPEKERDKEKAKHEKSLKLESPPDGARRKHTPSTYPRTRVSATTPAAERRSLERLKQQLNYSDHDDVSNNGDRAVERNNERAVVAATGSVGSVGSSYERQMNHHHANRQQQPPHGDAAGGSTAQSAALPHYHQESGRAVQQQQQQQQQQLLERARDNPLLYKEKQTQPLQKNNSVKRPQSPKPKRQPLPDSNQLVSRLMKVRDYIKQATIMVDRLKGAPTQDTETVSKCRKLGQVIDQLRDQEQNYMDFLMKVLSSEEAALLDGSSQAEDDTTSVDMDAQSDISQATTEASIAGTRPQIESHLGFYPSVDDDRAPSALAEGDYAYGAEQARRYVREKSNTEQAAIGRSGAVGAAGDPGGDRDLDKESSFLEMRARELEMLTEDQRRIHDIIAGEAKAAMEEKQGELEALRQQRDLLKNMLQQQRQLRDLQGRQVALLQQQRESHLDIHQQQQQQGGHLFSVDQPEDDEEAAGAAADTQSVDSEIMAQKLHDLKSQLDYARNMYTSHTDKSAEDKSCDDLAERNSDSMSLASVERQKNHLLNKLHALQGEKSRMDNLLGELQVMRDSRFQQLNNELDSGAETALSKSSELRMAVGQRAVQSATNTIDDASNVLDLLDAEGKMKKLEDVRSRLSQLRDLVQYYESGTRFIHDEDGDEDESEQIPPAMEDIVTMRKDLQAHREALSQLAGIVTVAVPSSLMTTTTSAQRGASDDEQDDDSSSDDEENFTLGSFHDDPEILAQVNKLKSAKKRLTRLKQMVENMPDWTDDTGVNALVDVEQGGGDYAMEEPRDNRDAYRDDGGDEQADDSEMSYRAKVEEQKGELRKLMEERKRLLGVQEQLQKLYQRLPSVPSGGQEVSETSSNNPATKSAALRPASGKNKDSRLRESVTFHEPPQVASNDELYNKMRSQRILREELRSRKRELEAIMRKGDLRKPYSRLNQDNQSDNISYSNKSDTFGFGSLSADVTTMATWGDSTTENNEESKNSTHSNSTSTSDNENNQDDDGYPSDGIVQVEEEEEDQSDANTYTIEEDEEEGVEDVNDARRPGTTSGSKHLQPPIVDVQAQSRASLPADRKSDMRTRYNAWASDSYPRISVQRADKKLRSKGQLRQENYRSPEEIVRERSGAGNSAAEDAQTMSAMQKKLELTTSLCHTLMRDQQALNRLLKQSSVIATSASADGYRGSGMAVPPVPVPVPVPVATPTAPDQTMAAYTQQLIQQQMQLGLQQCQQLIYQQQMEIRQLNAHMMSLSGHHDDFSFQPSFLSPMSPIISLETMRPRLWGVDGDERAPGRPPTDPDSCRNQSSKRSPQNVKAEVPKLKLDGMKRRKEQKGANKRPESAVVGRKYPAGERASAAASLASKMAPKSQSASAATTGAKKPRSASAQPRPGLSAMISGTSFLDDGQSSQVSSIPPTDTFNTRKRLDDADADLAVGLSLFEALRENIYSEVASLISQNEGRPHYLVELFRELQLLTSDYLRQRALYALKDLVSNTLSQELDDDQERQEYEEDRFGATDPLWLPADCRDVCEQTPSESLITSDDDDNDGNTGAPMSSSHGKQEVSAVVKKCPVVDLSGGDADFYDYVETVENMSLLSTPSSAAGGAWDGPFAQDSLGDTVIHLDKAMARMREYDRKLSEGLVNAGADSSPLFKRSPEGVATAPLDTQQRPDRGTDGSGAALQDQANESSESESQPHIDTRQLDSKIKSIMTQVIPILKTHMEDTCSADLLSYMKTVILALAHQRGDQMEHGQFFHKQLARLIQDTLIKYQGRKMMECVEDLVVDISEILFSELAFYHLMKDLDDPMQNAARKCERQDLTSVAGEQSSRPSASTGGTGAVVNGQSGGARLRTGLIEYESTDDNDLEDDDNEQSAESALSGQMHGDQQTTDLDDTLDKERDDEMAGVVNVDDDEDSGDDDGAGRVKTVQLSVSETKPYNRIGSDEDDEGDDDDDGSLEDECDTAVSRDVEMEATLNGAMNDAMNGAVNDVTFSKELLQQRQDGEKDVDEVSNLCQLITENSVADAEERTESVLTLDDLPVKLDINQADFQSDRQMARAAEESAAASLSAAVDEALAEAGYGELAGDDEALAPPNSVPTEPSAPV